MRKKLRIFSFFLFLLVFLTSGFIVSKHYIEEKNLENQYESLVGEVEAAKDNLIPVQNKEATILPEYAELYKKNNELVGWIKIENMQINYPVMQSVNEPNFYLKHLFDKTYSNYGCPYVEQKCDMSKPSDNLIIYGHHMKSDKMFSQLEKFKKKEFWEAHKYVSFDTLFEKQTYEIVAAFKTVVYTDNPNMFRYYEFIDADTPEAFNEYISRAKKMSAYDTGVTAVYGDKLITLSTCEFSNKNGRFVVVAKRIA